MQTLDVNYRVMCAAFWLNLRGRFRHLFLLLAILVGIGGCSKDPANEAMKSDANGYFCRHCKAKLFTKRTVFLENCPKCNENALADVIGYWCEKDQHLTIRPKIAGPEGASVCEKCNQPLKNAMVSPREKNLVAWGATKTQLK